MTTKVNVKVSGGSVRWPALLTGVTMLAGCASFQPQSSDHLFASDPQLRACAQWYESLDARVDKAGVRDVQETRIRGYPYLRADRLLASFRDAAAADDASLRALVERMQTLDLDARRVEITNATSALDETSVNEALTHAKHCADVMRAADLASPASRASILARSTVPDAYSRTSRVLGLYALARMPFGLGVKRHQREVLAAFDRELSTPADALLLRFSPPDDKVSSESAASAIERASANPLRIPDVQNDDLAKLFATHAPEFEIEVSGAYDRIGALQWQRGAKIPWVNIGKPVVYRRAAWTRYRSQTLLQLVYTVWFAERPPASASDLLSGRLDGLTWRVTLSPDGEALIYDTIHPCGCYHMFFPTPRAVALSPPGDAVEFMFSPQSLPRIKPGERVRVRIAARTHYVERVTVVGDIDAMPRYELADADALRSLPLPDGGHASIYAQNGLITGTERAERFLFWPMGIASAGAMRQWGHHATAFVGRRHFDDADLIEKRFDLTLQ